ncbi:roadblock/LC7 domain-containing protein [Streptomyces sp. NBC_00846]|uniref:roadblock/LC7 domain-containing protein n=1 Tax=Streptomyces sp. NBC_00846 TaxID=2975849 RepID=UPI003870E87A|nr:roadblock/LC7 domain-containing protein [Streptomyces sp. NBC_00846]
MKQEMTVQQPVSLDWLLDDFTGRVPGVWSAVLASNDGIRLSHSQMADITAESVAARMTGLYSLGNGLGSVVGEPESKGGVKQVVIEHDATSLFVMSAGRGLPAGAMRPGTDPDTVGTLLGVLAKPDADMGLIGYEMGLLINSVAQHLVIPTRRGDASVIGH